jgi:hypothetical protein
MFSRRCIRLISLPRTLPSRNPHVRNVSLNPFRDNKVPPAVDEKVAVPSNYRPSTSSVLHPPLKLVSAVAARPKREKRRLPLFPEGTQWTGILGDSAGDDAFVVGKYYLGTPTKWVLI